MIQELCPQEQQIHHAELLAIIQAQESFSHAISHSDSASAIATFHAAPMVQGKDLHRHPYPDLCQRIADLPFRDCNRVVKIKGHVSPAMLSDLQCYHALGNAAADQAAEAACLRTHTALTDTWLAHARQGQEDIRLLQEFYQLSLALQIHRKEVEAHQPASFNPDEPHPARQASAFCDLLGRWSIPHGWRLDLPAATEHHFFGHSYWGSSLLLCILSWLSAFVWPLDDPASAPEHTRVGVSWMELALSFVLYAKGYIPLHRPAATPCHTFAWAGSKSEAAAFNYTWNECAAQFAGMVSQVISLCCQPVIPAHVRRARICSLYRQGAGTCVFGWSHRPEFPCQTQSC